MTQSSIPDYLVDVGRPDPAKFDHLAGKLIGLGLANWDLLWQGTMV